MVLGIVLAIQLLLLAYQVKSGQDIRLIRVWAVTAITPAARVIESIRSGTTGFFSDYFLLLDVRDENRRMKSEVGRLKLENQFLKTELSTADRARALAAFQSRSPSHTIPARIIGNGTGANAKVVFIDRGSSSGIEKGMAVITPDGIVGKVIQAFPVAAQVLLITDPTFAAGVISQRNHVRGTVKGQGGPNCFVDYIQNEEKVDKGEWFYTSGDDRVFPKGLPVGQVTVARAGKSTKEVFIAPSGFQGGFEEVLVVLEGVHQPIPEPNEASTALHLLPPPPADPNAVQTETTAPLATDADRLVNQYKRIGEAQQHGFGQYGTPPPNFNVDPEKVRRAAEAAAAAAHTGPSTTANPNPATAGAPKPEAGKPPAQNPTFPKPAATQAAPGSRENRPAAPVQ